MPHLLWSPMSKPQNCESCPLKTAPCVRVPLSHFTVGVLQVARFGARSQVAPPAHDAVAQKPVVGLVGPALEIHVGNSRRPPCSAGRSPWRPEIRARHADGGTFADDHGSLQVRAGLRHRCTRACDEHWSRIPYSTVGGLAFDGKRGAPERQPASVRRRQWRLLGRPHGAQVSIRTCRQVERPLRLASLESGQTAHWRWESTSCLASGAHASTATWRVNQVWFHASPRQRQYIISRESPLLSRLPSPMHFEPNSSDRVPTGHSPEGLQRPGPCCTRAFGNGIDDECHQLSCLCECAETHAGHTVNQVERVQLQRSVPSSKSWIAGIGSDGLGACQI